MNVTVQIHLLRLWDTSSVMFLQLPSVLDLSTSFMVIQVSQLGLIRPQLVSRWLTCYCPLLCHSYPEAVPARSVVLQMALFFLSPLMPDYLKALVNDQRVIQCICVALQWSLSSYQWRLSSHASLFCYLALLTLRVPIKFPHSILQSTGLADIVTQSNVQLRKQGQ